MTHSTRFLLHRACEQAMAMLKQNMSAVDAVAQAIAVLEDDSVTNAGYGSNLTIEATVECDASLMDGRDGSFGAVGAVKGLKNPILMTKRMIRENQKGLMSLGRIPPMFLVGSGAKAWAEQHDIPVLREEHELLSREAIETYVNHKQRLEYAQDSLDLGHDTVGAICVDAEGNIAAGVSSGGISMKYPGRVGEAAMYGCGCWAQNRTDCLSGVACSTSGTGEQIMRTMLTSRCVQNLVQESDMQQAITRTIRKEFLASPYLQMYDDKSVGIIALRMDSAQRIEFWYAHVTESMGIGYMSGSSKRPKTFISRRHGQEDITAAGLLVV
ncbi:taspase, threonine aspartase, 1 [Apophysomyces ossiformis]|uniref:Taspase, threonine aspartase, 1 n=1 Tax=Apophysomyces ossiformis TaxID=679940 RepID=A0A8H7ET34_9FUNG|nr:taspase, threonine aspartase, 1 [Apophysomyces ossiformis]